MSTVKHKKTGSVPLPTKTRVELSKVKKSVKNQKGQRVSKKNAAGVLEYESVAMALSLPSANRPLRWSSHFSSLPTAVAAPWAIIPAPWQANGSAPSASSPFTTNDMFACVFRSAERAMVVYDANPTNQTYGYDLFGSAPQGVYAPSIPSQIFNPGLIAVGSKMHLHTPVGFSKTGAQYSPHGPVVFAGSDGQTNARYFWFDKNTSVSVTLTCSSTGSLNVGFDLWTADGISEDVLAANPAMVLNVPQTVAVGSFTQSGYYALYIANTQTVNVLISAFSAVTSGAQAVMRHLCLQNYASNAVACAGVRVNSASLMYTNDASPLNKQGKIVMYQAPQNSQWTDYVGVSGFLALTGAQGSKTMTADNGMYAFLKPTQPEDFDIQSNIDTFGTSITDSHYPLTSNSAYLVLFAQVTTAAGQDGYFTVAHGIEYQTQDVWRAVAPAAISPEIFDQGLEFLRRMEQFHENPLHFEDIWNEIKKTVGSIFSGFKEYLPLATNAVKAVTPLIGML